MPIPVQCPQCQRAIQVADKFAGCKIRCPKCGDGVISVDAAPATGNSAASDQPYELKPASAPRSGNSQAAKPAFRGRFRQKSVLGSLTIVGVGLGVVLFVGGLLVSAGSYAWRGIRQLGMPELTQSEVSLPQASTSKVSPLPGMIKQANNSPSTTPDWQLYQSGQPPFEILFPRGRVAKLIINEGIQFRWSPQDPRHRQAGEVALLSVSYFRRFPWESDLEAIARAERMSQTSLLGAELNGVAVGRRETRFQGKFAVERTMNDPLAQVVAVSTSFVDSTSVYTIEGLANRSLFTLAQLRTMRDSFRNLEPAASPNTSLNQLPDHVRHEFPPVGPPRFNPRPPSVQEEAKPVGLVADWELFRSPTHPFEILFPFKNVQVMTKGESTEYVCVGDGQLNHAGRVVPDIGLFRVRHFPRLPNESDQEAVLRVERIAGVPRDGIFENGVFRNVGSRTEHVTAMHDGFYSDECRLLGDTRGLRILGLLIGHPSGVYQLTGVISDRLMSAAELEKYRQSFRFVR